MKTLAELDFDPFHLLMHCLKSVQIRSYFWSVFSCIQTEYGEVLSPNAGKYGREITLYLDTFHIVTFFKHYRHCSPL